MKKRAPSHRDLHVLTQRHRELLRHKEQEKFNKRVLQQTERTHALLQELLRRVPANSSVRSHSYPSADAGSQWPTEQSIKLGQSQHLQESTLDHTTVREFRSGPLVVSRNSSVAQDAVRHEDPTPKRETPQREEAELSQKSSGVSGTAPYPWNWEALLKNSQVPVTNLNYKRQLRNFQKWWQARPGWQAELTKKGCRPHPRANPSQVTEWYGTVMASEAGQAKAALKWLVENCYHAPWEHYKPLIPTRVLQGKQGQGKVDHPHTAHRPERFVAFVESELPHESWRQHQVGWKVLFWGPCRVQDLSTIPADVKTEWVNSQWIVGPWQQQKTHTPRVLCLSPEVMEAIQAWRTSEQGAKLCKANNNWLGFTCGSEAARKQLARYSKHFWGWEEEKALQTHDGRHTYVTWMADKGVPMDKLQQLLGHNDSRTTEIYRGNRQIADTLGTWGGMLTNTSDAGSTTTSKWDPVDFQVKLKEARVVVAKRIQDWRET